MHKQQSLHASQRRLHIEELSVALLEKLNQINRKYQGYPEVSHSLPVNEEEKT